MPINAILIYEVEKSKTILVTLSLFHCKKKENVKMLNDKFLYALLYSPPMLTLKFKFLCSTPTSMHLLT